MPGSGSISAPVPKLLPRPPRQISVPPDDSSAVVSTTADGAAPAHTPRSEDLAVQGPSTFAGPKPLGKELHRHTTIVVDGGNETVRPMRSSTPSFTTLAGGVSQHVPMPVKSDRTAPNASCQSQEALSDYATHMHRETLNPASVAAKRWNVTTEFLSAKSEEDKDAIIFLLQKALMEAQNGGEDALSRAAIVSARNISLQDQLDTAKKRENESRQEINALRKDLEVARGLLQMQFQDAHSRHDNPETSVHSDSSISDAKTSHDSPSSSPDITNEISNRKLVALVETKDVEIKEQKRAIEALSSEVQTLKAAVGDAASGSSNSMHEALKRDFVKMRDRVKMVEEALRAMRDEAREHVLSIQAPDIESGALLGSGSFAEVRRATWKLPCAVKRLKDSVRSNPYEVRKFEKEAYLLRSLLHPGIVRVFGFCKIDFLLVSEVVVGGSLHDLIHQEPQSILPIDVALGYSAQAADILRYLHLCSVVHRDIKPENLLVRDDGILKLADFGLACEQRGAYVQTRSNLAGTPRYMAPEAYRDEKCTEKIDIYSLSMMMWEMFTGQLPWEGSNFQDVRHAVANLGKRPPVPENLTEPVAKVGCDLFASCPA